MSMDTPARRKVGAVNVMSGAVMVFVGLYFLLMSENTIVGGALLGAGVLDIVVGLVFLRG